MNCELFTDETIYIPDEVYFIQFIIALHVFCETSLIFFHFQLSKCEHPEKILHQIRISAFCNI